MATVAPTAASSLFFALTLLVTLGRPLLPEAKPGPVLTRLVPTTLLLDRGGGTPEVPTPLTVDCLRVVVAAVLVGLVFEASLVRTAMPFLKVVDGGSGSGRLLTVFVLLIGESFRADKRGGGMADF